MRVLLLVLLLLVLLGCSPPTQVSFPGQGLTLRVELAVTPEEKAQGLSGRDSLQDGTGMLFLFDEEEPRLFWMKGMRVPLDILFLDSRKKVVHLVQGAQPCAGDPCPLYPSRVPARYVLEIPAGMAAQHGLEVGQYARFR